MGGLEGDGPGVGCEIQMLEVVILLVHQDLGYMTTGVGGWGGVNGEMIGVKGQGSVRLGVAWMPVWCVCEVIGNEKG